MKDSLFFWWVTFASGAGMALLALGVFIASQQSIAMFVLVAEVWLVWLAIRNLKRLYAECPPNWTGRWQVRLSDMLSIAFFFGLMMAAFRAVDPSKFIYTIPIVSLLGFGYVASLLCVSRMDGELRGFSKWIVTVAVLVTAIFALVWGMGLQITLLAVLRFLIWR